MNAQETKMAEMARDAHTMQRTAYAKKHGHGKEAEEILRKIHSRRVTAQYSAFLNCRKTAMLNFLWGDKLATIARSMPSDGYSMGSVYIVEIVGANFAKTVDRTQEYDGSRWHAKHSCCELVLTAKEFVKIEIIGGMITIIDPTKLKGLKGVHACKWLVCAKYAKSPSWKPGFILEDYHFEDLGEVDNVRAILNQRKIAANLAKKGKVSEAKLLKSRKKVSYRVSIRARNCDPGTRLFIKKHNLDINTTYRLGEIYAMATQSERPYVAKMYNVR